MGEYELIGYQLVKEIPIREKPAEGETHGDILDWNFEVVAESKTVNGLVRFAKLKKIDPCGEFGYFVESKEKRRLPNYPGKYLPDSGNIFHKSLEEIL